MTQPLALPWRRIFPRALVATAGSAAGVALAAALEAPIWVVGVVGLAPWLPLLVGAVVVTRRVADGWLALYLALALTQTGHVGEHVVQVIQLRLLGLSGEHAHGVFGALDIEWVHFGWNAWILLAVALLLVRFRANPWLWLTLPLAGWHLAEHVLLLAIYLATGVPGSPGLLATGGLLGGGLPVARPDLHLLYNLVETVPLILGLRWQWRQAPPLAAIRR
jgi:hypothetical protein